MYIKIANDFKLRHDINVGDLFLFTHMKIRSEAIFMKAEVLEVYKEFMICRILDTARRIESEKIIKKRDIIVLRYKNITSLRVLE